MVTTPDLTVAFTIDTSAIMRDLRKAKVAAEQMAEALDGVMRLLRAAPTVTGRSLLAAHRDRVGGNGRDATAHPEMWQSAVCAAWLHDSCPSDRSHLSCTCTCHRKAPR